MRNEESERVIERERETMIETVSEREKKRD